VKNVWLWTSLEWYKDLVHPLLLKWTHLVISKCEDGFLMHMDFIKNSKSFSSNINMSGSIDNFVIQFLLKVTWINLWPCIARLIYLTCVQLTFNLRKFLNICPGSKAAGINAISPEVLKQCPGPITQLFFVYSIYALAHALFLMNGGHTL